MPSELPDVWLNKNPKHYGNGMFSATQFPVMKDYHHYIPASRLAELEAKHARLLELAGRMAMPDNARHEEFDARLAYVASVVFRTEFGSQGGA